MPTQKTRINISVPSDINQILHTLAQRDDVPVATKALHLLQEALELEEDRIHSAIADTRLSKAKKWHSKDKVWKKYMS